MLDVCLCHAPADRAVADEIAARLEGAEVNVQREETGAGPYPNVAAAWEAGTFCRAVLLVLSPDAVPATRGRAEWGPLLDHVPPPDIAAVRVRDCRYPALLERRPFFRWDESRVEALRAVERWILSLDSQGRQPSFRPARLEWLKGRPRELELLWEALVDGDGGGVCALAGAAHGKTSLAQQFACDAVEHFRDVFWIQCSGRSSFALGCDLAAQLGIPIDDATDDVWRRAIDVLREHRVLVVFDDVAGQDLPLADSSGRASVLITTRHLLFAGARIITLDSAPVAAPIVPTEDPIDLRLWQAMAVCRPQGFPLELAARIAGLDLGTAAAAAERLVARRLADPFDRIGPRLRLSSASRAAARLCADVPALERRHAEAVHAALAAPTIPEFEAAFEWAHENDWELAVALGERGFKFFVDHRRLAEAAHVMLELERAARAAGNDAVADHCRWELSWLQDPWQAAVQPTAITGEQMTLDFGRM